MEKKFVYLLLASLFASCVDSQKNAFKACVMERCADADVQPVCAEGRPFMNLCQLQCDNDGRISDGRPTLSVTCNMSCRECQSSSS